MAALGDPLVMTAMDDSIPLPPMLGTNDPGSTDPGGVGTGSPNDVTIPPFEEPALGAGQCYDLFGDIVNCGEGDTISCYPADFTGPLPPGAVSCGSSPTVNDNNSCYPTSFTGPLPPGGVYCPPGDSSNPCYPSNFTGPLPPGASYCSGQPTGAPAVNSVGGAAGAVGAASSTLANAFNALGAFVGGVFGLNKAGTTVAGKPATIAAGGFLGTGISTGVLLVGAVVLILIMRRKE